MADSKGRVFYKKTKNQRKETVHRPAVQCKQPHSLRKEVEDWPCESVRVDTSAKGRFAFLARHLQTLAIWPRVLTDIVAEYTVADPIDLSIHHPVRQLYNHFSPWRSKSAVSPDQQVLYLVIDDLQPPIEMHLAGWDGRERRMNPMATWPDWEQCHCVDMGFHPLRSSSSDYPDRLYWTKKTQGVIEEDVSSSVKCLKWKSCIAPFTETITVGGKDDSSIVHWIAKVENSTQFYAMPHDTQAPIRFHDHQSQITWRRSLGWRGYRRKAICANSLHVCVIYEKVSKEPRPPRPTLVVYTSVGVPILEFQVDYSCETLSLASSPDEYGCWWLYATGGQMDVIYAYRIDIRLKHVFETVHHIGWPALVNDLDWLDVRRRITCVDSSWLLVESWSNSEYSADQYGYDI